MKDLLAEKDAEVVLEILADKLEVAKAQLTPEAKLEHDLGADSLDVVVINMELEERFEISIPDDRAETVRTVGDIFEVLAELLQAHRR